jgi:hypothetical protein
MANTSPQAAWLNGVRRVAATTIQFISNTVEIRQVIDLIRGELALVFMYKNSIGI